MKMKFKSFNASASLLAAVGGVLLLSIPASASIIFDDFNVNEGFFNTSPKFSATTSATIDTTSTADRATSPSPLEGAGFERLTLDVIGTTTARVRFLSNTGTPSPQTSFTTSASATDGWIGYYVRLAAGASGIWQTGINLDSTANSSGTMLGSSRVTIPADGQWHLFEWNLDSAVAADWGQVGGIGGYTSMANALAAGDPHTWTIDSIYFYSSGNVSGTGITIDLDFVAKSDSGSIASLVPEPSSFALVALGGGILFLIQRRRQA